MVIDYQTFRLSNLRLLLLLPVAPMIVLSRLLRCLDMFVLGYSTLTLSLVTLTTSTLHLHLLLIIKLLGHVHALVC